jgi:hypothetical protein
MTLLISPPLLHSMCRIRNTMLLVFDGTTRRTEWLHLTVLPSNLFEFGCSTHISVMVHNDRLLVRPRVETIIDTISPGAFSSSWTAPFFKPRKRRYGAFEEHRYGINPLPLVQDAPNRQNSANLICIRWEKSGFFIFRIKHFNNWKYILMEQGQSTRSKNRIPLYLYRMTLFLF